jgi:hypothetical protein
MKYIRKLISLIWLLKVCVKMNYDLFWIGHLNSECLHVKKGLVHIEFLNMRVERAPLERGPVTHIFEPKNHKLALEEDRA